MMEKRKRRELCEVCNTDSIKKARKRILYIQESFIELKRVSEYHTGPIQIQKRLAGGCGDHRNAKKEPV